MKVIRLLKKHHRLGDVVTNAAIAVLSVVYIWLNEDVFQDCAAAVLLGASLCAVIAIHSLARIEEERLSIREAWNETKEREACLEAELKSCRDKLENTCGELERMKSSVTALKENPLKSNRIVSDMTFAVRLRRYLNNSMVADGVGHEEKQYLLHVAEWLIKWQVKTVRRGTKEEGYLQELGMFDKEAANNEAQTPDDGTNGADKDTPVLKKEKIVKNLKQKKNINRRK